MPDQLLRDVRRRTGFALVAVLALSGLLGACDPEPTREEAGVTDGLLVLAGDVGATALELRESGTAGGRSIPLPADATTWVSAGRTNVLVATMIDGRTYVSDPLGEDDPTWRLVEPVTVNDVPPELALYFATWDPPGGAYAQLGADFTAGTGMRVVVTDPALGGATEAPIDDRRAIAVPPAWVDDDRVVVVAGTDGGGEALVVDTTSGEITGGPAGVRLVTTSAEAETLAQWRGGDAPVEVLETRAWLDGGQASVRIDAPAAGLLPAVLALDRSGDRLAIVWTEPDGGSPRVTVSARSREWATAASFELGDARAASVAWLR